MFRLNDQNRFEFINTAFSERFGADPSELYGVEIMTLVAAGDTQTLEQSLERVRNDGGLESEICTCRVGLHGEKTNATIELYAPDDRSDGDDIVGVVRTDSGSQLPETAEFHRDRFNQLFNLIDDAVVEVEILDSEPIVRSVNPGFEDLFGYPAEDVLGNSLNDFIVPDSHTNEAAFFDRRTADGKVNSDIVTRQTINGPQEFLYRGIPYNRTDAGQYGLAIYADMSDQKRTRQHLQVLHRVLRHNLRNELVVVMGQAEEIREQTDSPQIEKAATRIIERGETLETVSKKAQAAESVIGDSSSSIVDIAEITHEVVSEVQNRWSDATVEITVDETSGVQVSGKIRDAIYNLVENAIVHNSAQPTVRVEVDQYTPVYSNTRVSSPTELVVVRVADDGPGIPEHERAAVFGEEELTQLTHGSGLGLWVVQWVTESADGSVVYERDDGWTTIELRFPQASTNEMTLPSD